MAGMTLEGKGDIRREGDYRGKGRLYRGGVTIEGRGDITGGGGGG